MDPNTALALIGATAFLVSIPAPNVALIIANTITRGFLLGAITVFGTTIGVAIQLAIVVTGLAVLLELAASAFTWLKWGGVLYLLYLGIISWRQGIEDLQDATPSRKPWRVLFWQGLLLAMINPKTLLFNAAFLPQFVNPDAGTASLLPVATLYLCVIFLGDLLWAAFAESARPLILRLGRLRHRLTGCLFFGAAFGLALSRVGR